MADDAALVESLAALSRFFVGDQTMIERAGTFRRVSSTQTRGIVSIIVGVIGIITSIIDERTTASASGTASPSSASWS